MKRRHALDDRRRRARRRAAGRCFCCGRSPKACAAPSSTATADSTFAYVATVFRNPIYLEGLRNALAIAVAQHRHRGRGRHRRGRCSSTATTFPGRRLLAALVPLPLMVPPFVGAVGMKQLLGQRRRAQRAARTHRASVDPRAPDRLAARRALRGGRRADRAAPLPDRLLQRAGGARRPQPRDGGGGAQPRLPRPARFPQDHAAAPSSPASSPRRASSSSGRSPSSACR